MRITEKKNKEIKKIIQNERKMLSIFSIKSRINEEINKIKYILFKWTILVTLKPITHITSIWIYCVFMFIDYIICTLYFLCGVTHQHLSDHGSLHLPDLCTSKQRFSSYHSSGSLYINTIGSLFVVSFCLDIIFIFMCRVPTERRRPWPSKISCPS